MRWERRAPLAWVVFGAILVCAWCSFLSGLGGWIMGQDLARRATRAEIATAGASGADLPPPGVLVTRLDRGGPAAHAGVQRSDMIVAINGRAVQDAPDLREQLRGYHVGETVRLSVQREADTLSLPVDLAPFPGDIRRPYLGIYYTARADDPGDM